MNKLGTAFGGLLLIGALVAPVAFAHYDTGAHPLPYATTGQDIFGTDENSCGQVAVPATVGGVPVEDLIDGGFGVNAGPGFVGPNCGPGGRPGAPAPTAFVVNKDRVSGWYYGSTNTYVQLVSQFQGIPDPTNPPAGFINPSFLFAQWSGVYDAEVAGLGACPGGVHDPQDETTVDGLPGGLAPDGLFNDGGFGAVGHSTHYACPTYNTPGCDRYDQAWAEDMVSGEDIWIGAQCNWGVPTGGVGPGLGAVLTQFVNSLVNCPLGGFPQSCINALNYLDNCLTGGLLLPPAEPPGAYPGCGVVGGTVVCGAGTVSNIDFGRGQGSDGPAAAAATNDGAWYPNAGTDSNGVNCDAFATAVAFPFTAVIVTQNAGGALGLEQVSAATHGWVA